MKKPCQKSSPCRVVTLETTSVPSTQPSRLVIKFEQLWRSLSLRVLPRCTSIARKQENTSTNTEPSSESAVDQAMPAAEIQLRRRVVDVLCGVHSSTRDRAKYGKRIATNAAKQQRLGCRHKRHRRHSAPPLPCQYTPLEPRLVLSATFPTFIGGQFTLGDANAEAPYGLQNTFKLNSLPGADKTIYLDFNGHHSVNNEWNHNYLFPAFSFTKGKSFSNSELIRIQKIYQNVAEDFLPFEINVTTEAPRTSDLIRSNGADDRFGVRVVFTQTRTFGYGYGGLALKNTFRSRSDTPVFVFEKTENIAAIVASHEVGHSLGLSHDGYYGQEYHPGINGWGPLMGAPYRAHVTQWSNGDYAGSSTRQDDISLIARTYNGVQLRQDDVGSTFDSSTPLKKSVNQLSAHGFITHRNDVDAFRFTLPHRAEVDLSVKPFQGRGNLDILAQIRNESGELIASSDSHSRRDAQFTLELDPGNYYLTVDGTGKSGVYSDYGSLGFYSITGTLSEGPTRSIGFSGVAKNVSHKWKTIQLPRDFINPVIIAGPPSTKGEDPATVRIRNVTNRSFEIAIDEWDYLNQTHSPEMIGYVVVESGTHQLPDGTRIVAGNGYLNHVSRRIGFGQVLGERPNVFTQVVSHRGPSAVATRVFNVTTGGFNLKMQEQDLSDGRHSSERFSWLAVEQTATTVNQQVFESRITSRQFTHEDLRVRFQSEFAKPPVLIAGMQTFNGPDAAVVRHRSINSQNATLFLQEEQSEDQEQEHTKETLAILALDRGNVFAVDNSRKITAATSSYELHAGAPAAIEHALSLTSELDIFLDTFTAPPESSPSISEAPDILAAAKQDASFDRLKDRLFAKLALEHSHRSSPWF